MFKINYKKIAPIHPEIMEKQYLETNCDIQSDSEASPLSKSYIPFAIKNIQLYNPIYQSFFEMSPQNVDRVALNHPYHIKDLHSVVNTETSEIIKRDIFTKFSPLLDPYHYMMGRYDINQSNIRTLPTLNSTNETVHPKMLLQNNASYVDCFFNYLSSSLLHQHGFVNGVDFYGSFLGIQKQFRVNICDDLGYLYGSEFFNDNVGKLFHIDGSNKDPFIQMDGGNGSRRNKKRLLIDNGEPHNISGISIVNLDEIEPTSEVTDNYEVVYSRSMTSSSTSTSSSSSENSEDDDEEWETDNSEDEDKDEDEDEDKDEDDDEDEDEDEENDEEIYAYIDDFPIQMICLEKCQGTLDQLFADNLIDPTNGASALFQIVMSLLIYQKAFKFTHNDLHTNNIMYIETDIEYLYYKYADIRYRVPTYGRIFKIIDFGRSIYKFQNNLFCSDSFASGGDAATQYNFEPFMNSKKPRLEPNYSFDLARLGSSIFDFILDIDVEADSMDELQKTIHRWCLDNNGRNILYKKNGDERYPSFKLYKMIARTVSDHTPEAQLEYEFFSQYAVSKEEDLGNSTIFDIDALPVYV